MAVTCAKGHVNDDTNRFCDQCGLPLQAAPAVAPQEVTFVSMPAAGASSVACPVCGQENVPGTAFCDNCGAVLPPPQPAVDQQDAAGAAPIAQAQPDAATVVCPSCGTSNDAVNRFCENCGASLVPAEAGANAQSNGRLTRRRRDYRGRPERHYCRGHRTAGRGGGRNRCGPAS